MNNPCDDVPIWQVALIIDTNSYAGNYHREVAAFLTGHTDEYDEDNKYIADFKELLETDEVSQEVVNELQRIATNCKHDEYDYVHSTLAATPNRVNNGRGKNSDGAVGKTEDGSMNWPAYESVAVFLSDVPSGETMQFLKKRAHKMSLEEFKYGSSDDIKVTGVRCLVHKQTSTISEISIK